MADEVGLGAFYRPFYSRASGMQHVDFGGVMAQVGPDSVDVQVAPSESCAIEALSMGFDLAFRALYDFNHVASMGAEEGFRRAKDLHTNSRPHHASTGDAR